MRAGFERAGERPVRLLKAWRRWRPARVPSSSCRTTLPSAKPPHLEQAREAIRGTGGLADGVRAVYALWQPKEDQAKKSCEALGEP